MMEEWNQLEWSYCGSGCLRLFIHKLISFRLFQPHSINLFIAAFIWWNNVIITVWLYHCTVIIQFNSFKLFMNQIEILSFLLGRKNDWFDEWKESCSLHWKSRFSNYAIIGYEFLPQLSLNKSIPSFFL